MGGALNGTDTLALTCALLVALTGVPLRLWVGQRQKPTIRHFVNDILRGITIVPLAAIIYGLFFNAPLFEQVMRGNKLLVGISVVISLLYIVGDYVRSKDEV